MAASRPLTLQRKRATGQRRRGTGQPREGAGAGKVRRLDDDVRPGGDEGLERDEIGASYRWR
jgi:hypothetical protein